MCKLICLIAFYETNTTLSSGVDRSLQNLTLKRCEEQEFNDYLKEGAFYEALQKRMLSFHFSEKISALDKQSL